MPWLSTIVLVSAATSSSCRNPRPSAGATFSSSKRSQESERHIDPLALSLPLNVSDEPRIGNEVLEHVILLAPIEEIGRRNAESAVLRHDLEHAD